ncbi:MAG: phosphate ABC transporter ATP-binding protein [Candidatus Thermoplasmatota archaeon]|nr:phosphate ABC transporter ATP-binding protein [Candidatus Thermoplasmatota archaeon]
MTAIELLGIDKAYGDKKVLSNVDMVVEEGEIMAIIGPSGVGKTTLLRIANGLERPDCGSVNVLGTPLSYENGGDITVRRRMATILQKPVAFRDTVRNNVSYGLHVRGEQDVDGKVDRALEEVGLTPLADRHATTLSGGEMQRMAFARATVFEPSVLLLDEFTANLDPHNVGVLERAVQAYHGQKGATVIIVTHNLFQARRVATKTAFLLGGTMVEIGPTENIFEDPGDHRTRAFVNGEMVF